MPSLCRNETPSAMMSRVGFARCANILGDVDCVYGLVVKGGVGAHLEGVAL